MSSSREKQMKKNTCRQFLGLIFYTAITLVMVTLGSKIGCAQSAIMSEYVEAAEKSRTFLHQMQKVFKIPGMAVAVGIKGEIVWAEGFGFADLEKELPATPQTLFRIGSISKVLTACAVAMLYEAGKLDLDVPIRKYVPEFPNKGYTITTRQLAGHLSGIRHYNLDEPIYERKKHYDSVISALEVFKDDPLKYLPGEKWSYSSYGWVLISAVVQRAAGQPFRDYMKQHILQSLGMNHTVPDDINANIPNRTIFYDEGKVTPGGDISYILAGGGFLSTVEDLVRYGLAHLPGSGFLKPETMELLFINQKTISGKRVQHGIGWMVDKFENGKYLYYHTGLVLGGHGILTIQPEDGIVVAILANEDSRFGEHEANQIAWYFLGLNENEWPEIVGERERRAARNISINLLQSALEAWKGSINDGDLNAVMVNFSEHFRSTKWENKSAMRRYFQDAFVSGNAEVDDEEAHLRFQGHEIGSLSYVEGIKAISIFNDASIRLTFTREAAGWMITNLELLKQKD
jgi:CubicO group peptidase (beta-lactamase class C family)